MVSHVTQVYDRGTQFMVYYKVIFQFNYVITCYMKGGYLYQRYYIIMHDWNAYFEPGYVFYAYNSSHCTVQWPREQ